MTGRIDPYKNFKFRLEIDGVTKAGFREASGLDAEPSGTEENSQTAPEPGNLSGLHSNITLKWGVTDDKSLLEWGKETPEATAERKNGSIILMDEKREIARWNFVNGWPMKWTGPSFNAETSEAEIESLEISHEGLTREHRD